MPRPHPLVLFALGTAMGAVGWFTLSPLLRATPANSAATRAGQSPPDAAHTGARAPDSTAGAATSARVSTDDASDASESALPLWQVLARRGAPTGNEARWFTLPDMTGQGGYDAASPDAPINPAFAAFFDLTPEERDLAQALLQSTLRLQHQMDVARIERIESKFRIKNAIGIPDYATESAVLRQTFEGGLHAILGDERLRVYQDWAANTFRNDFPGLAGVRREYHIIPAREGDAPGSLQIVTVKLAPGEEWKGMHFTSYHANFQDALERTQLPLSRYLPAPDAESKPAAPVTP